MRSKYIIRKRQNAILYFEFFLASGIGAILLVIYLKLHAAIGLLIFIPTIFLLWYLFFTFRLFRYLFSILFSAGWSAAAFLAGKAVDEKSATTAWVFAAIALLFAVWAHWDHFTFLKDAKLYEYEKH